MAGDDPGDPKTDVLVFDRLAKFFQGLALAPRISLKQSGILKISIWSYARVTNLAKVEQNGIFPAALKLRYSHGHVHRPYVHPWGKAGIWVSTALITFWVALGSFQAIFPDVLEKVFGVGYVSKDTWGVGRGESQVLGDGPREDRRALCWARSRRTPAWSCRAGWR